MTDLTELRRLAEAATPGEWKRSLATVDKSWLKGRIQEAVISPSGIVCVTAESDADADFITAMAPVVALSLITRVERAEATLRAAGYTYHGGERWKPPLGPAPDFSAMDRAERAEAEAARMREALGALLREARYLTQQLAARGVPGVPGDTVDRVMNAARAALDAAP